MLLDLRNLSFDDWLRAVFDHDVPARAEDPFKDFDIEEGDEVEIIVTVDAIEADWPKQGEDEWYWGIDLELAVDPITQIELLTHMFDNPSILLDMFTVEQIDQGLWFIFGAGGGDDFYRHLWNPQVPWPSREQAILTIPNMWPGLFERADVGTMSYMLWDSLTHDYDGGPLDPSRDAEAKRVQDAILRALIEQLTSGDPDTQAAALHGLGHLRHPDTSRALEPYLRRDDLEEEVKKYAIGVARGKRVL